MKVLQQISAFTTVFACLSALPAILIGRRSNHILWYYACASFIADALSYWLKTQHIDWWLIVPNIFVAAQQPIVTKYIFDHSQDKTLRMGSMMLSFALSTWYLIDAIPTWKTEINYSAIGLLYAVMVVMMLWAFKYIIRGVQPKRIERSPLFIFSSAFLLYTSGTIIYFLVRKHIDVQSPAFKKVLTIFVNHGLNSLKNLAVAYALYLYGKDRHVQ